MKQQDCNQEKDDKEQVGSMGVKKEISLEHNTEIIEELVRTKAKVPKTVSLKKFIEMNFQAFVDSGKTLQEIYTFLKEKRIDVGSYNVFRTLYGRVKTSRKISAASVDPKTLSTQSEEYAQTRQGKMQMSLRKGSETDVRKEEQPQTRISKHNPALPPILLPGGEEAIIDPETGAKGFEIRSGKE
jgi:hypothetical protein